MYRKLFVWGGCYVWGGAELDLVYRKVVSVWREDMGLRRRGLGRAEGVLVYRKIVSPWRGRRDLDLCRDGAM